MANPNKRILIVGAGFGGLALARALARSPVEVVVVDARNHHTFQPLLYQVATAALEGPTVCYPLRGILGRQANARFIMAEAVGADLAGRRLVLADGTELAYDELVLATGAVTNDFGVVGAADKAFGLKSLDEALRIRDHLLLQFEAADARQELIEDGALTVAIVGGGATGVELAGGMIELIRQDLARDFPRLEARAARVVLIEAGDRLLASLSPATSLSTRRVLERMGVEVLLGASVASISEHELRFADGRRLPAFTTIWAAGVKAQALGADLGLPVTRSGRVQVDEELRAPGHPEIHVIGDLAAALGPRGLPLPQVAPVAIQEAHYTARLIDAEARPRVLGGSPRGRHPFRYRDKGSMATIGRQNAVAELPGGLRFAGALGWFAWLFLHLIMLVGFRNRLLVLVNWAWYYLTAERGNRIITRGVERHE